MQVVLSIRAGRLSSTLLLCRLGTESPKNNIYRAFRELGRVIRTSTLLRYISEPELREEITAATNKVESYNEFRSASPHRHRHHQRRAPHVARREDRLGNPLAHTRIPDDEEAPRLAVARATGDPSRLEDPPHRGVRHRAIRVPTHLSLARHRQERVQAPKPKP
jgi:hypothetical protein